VQGPNANVLGLPICTHSADAEILFIGKVEVGMAKVHGKQITYIGLKAEARTILVIVKFFVGPVMGPQFGGGD
jgi:hypothetical protein